MWPARVSSLMDEPVGPLGMSTGARVSKQHSICVGVCVCAFNLHVCLCAHLGLMRWVNYTDLMCTAFQLLRQLLASEHIRNLKNPFPCPSHIQTDGFPNETMPKHFPWSHILAKGGLTPVTHDNSASLPKRVHSTVVTPLSLSHISVLPIWATSDRAFQVSPRADATDDL